MIQERRREWHLALHTTGPMPLIRNTIFYPPGENLVSFEGNAYQAIDNQQLDPCFADPDAFDFRLLPGSPAIDAGITDRAPETDFEERPRPQSDNVDICAYEYAPATQ